MRYNIAEIFQFAMRIEENGQACYTLLARKFADTPAVHDFFADLARQEGDHGHFFKALERKLERVETAYPMDEMDTAYLRAFADSSVFSKGELEHYVAAIHSLEQALAFAMEREKEAVTYYEGMKKLLPEAEHAALDEIIEEERRHYQQLKQGPQAAGHYTDVGEEK